MWSVRLAFFVALSGLLVGVSVRALAWRSGVAADPMVLLTLAGSLASIVVLWRRGVPGQDSPDAEGARRPSSRVTQAGGWTLQGLSGLAWTLVAPSMAIAAVCWGMIAAGEVAAGLSLRRRYTSDHRSDPGRRDDTRRRQFRGRRDSRLAGAEPGGAVPAAREVASASAVAHSAGTEVTVPESDWDEKEFPPSLVQRLIRTRGADEVETVTGIVRERFAPRQRTAVSHIAFCPPLPRMPAVSATQLEGPATSVKVSRVEYFGVRFELRLQRASERMEQVVFGFAAEPGQQEEAS